MCVRVRCVGCGWEPSEWKQVESGACTNRKGARERRGGPRTRDRRRREQKAQGRGGLGIVGWRPWRTSKLCISPKQKNRREPPAGRSWEERDMKRRIAGIIDMVSIYPLQSHPRTTCSNMQRVFECVASSSTISVVLDFSEGRRRAQRKPWMVNTDPRNSCEFQCHDFSFLQKKKNKH